MRHARLAKAIVAIVFAALLVTAAFAMYMRSDDRTLAAQRGAGPAAAAKMPKLIELFAVWCPPCQKMQPILNDLEKEYKGKVQFVRIDVDKNPDAAKKYKVKSIPVQIFYDKTGKMVLRHEGFFSKDQIKAQFTKMGIKPAK